MLQWSRAAHMTTISSVNDSLTDRVPTLRDFKTLGGYIVKIKTSVAELKIAPNFRKGKSTIHPLKFVAIFNSATKVLIFSIDPFKVSISFNSGTFDFFFFFSKMPSTMIPVNNEQ
jgi:hypothetical protein